MNQWKKETEKKLPARPQALRVINQQLWCCCGVDGIVVFDSELQQQRTIPSPDLSIVYDVAEKSNGEVIIATHSGLYHSSKGQRYRQNAWLNLHTCNKLRVHVLEC